MHRGIVSASSNLTQETVRRARWILISVGVGIALGLILLFARELPTRWTGVIILATMAPTAVLLVRNTEKLLLIALVVDIALGFDIALASRPGHKGGPSGFLISLMTLALPVGYALWLITREADGKTQVVVNKAITTPALVLLFTMLVSILQSTDKQLSMAQLFLELQFFLLYFYIANHVRSWATVRLVLTALVVCLLAISVLMLLQNLVGFQLSALGIASSAIDSSIASAESRVAGTFGSSNAAATFLAASIAITFAIYLTDSWLVDKRLALSALLLGIAALVMTQSRSAWAAFALTMLILTIRALRKRVGTRAILLLGLIVLILGLVFSTQITERLSTDDQGSAETRRWHAEWAFNILEDHMYTGIGLNNMWLLALRREYLPLELMGRENLNVIHNKYLMVWVETGLFGLLSFLWLLSAVSLSAVQSLLRAKETYASIIITGLLAGLVVFLVHMLSDPFGARTRPQLLWLIIALIAATSQLVKDEAQTPVEENASQVGAAP